MIKLKRAFFMLTLLVSNGGYIHHRGTMGDDENILKYQMENYEI